MNSDNDYMDVIYLDTDEIIINGNVVYGNFYKKVTSKKIFNKWSNRYFLIKKSGKTSKTRLLLLYLCFKSINQVKLF